MPPQRADVFRDHDLGRVARDKTHALSDSLDRSNASLASPARRTATAMIHLLRKGKEVQNMKKLLIGATIALSVLIPLGVANATPPNGPPGQDECDNGNSDHSCVPDPQPTQGQECQEHGNNGETTRTIASQRL